MTRAIIKTLADYQWEYEIGEEGREDVIRWKTLISQPATATNDISFGIAESPPGTSLYAHHHAPQEIYYITEGQGSILIGKETKKVSPGSIVYIPKHEIHGIKNVGDETLSFLWIFPVDCYYDIEYHEDKNIA